MIARKSLNRAVNCFVHSRSHEIEGHFEHTEIGPVWASARLYYCGKEYTAKIKRSTIHAQQRGQDLRGRYFGGSTGHALHLCRCKWTKQMIESARQDAKKLCAKLRIE